MKYSRKLPGFEYLAPHSIQQALSLLHEHRGKAKVIAGGTDLLIQMKRREVVPHYLISLKRIPGLNQIAYNAHDGLRIGPLVTLHDIETSPVIRNGFSILAQAVSTIGSAQIRNLASLAGNLCNGLPSADMAPPLIVLGAKLRLSTQQGEKILGIEDFFLGPSKTVLSDDDMLVEIRIPSPPPHSGGTFLKLTRRAAMELAIVNVATLITLEDGACKDVKIALGAVRPTPFRATRAEEVLRGKRIDDALIQEAAETAARASRARTSPFRGSAEYRRQMAKVLTRRALKQSWEQVA